MMSASSGSGTAVAFSGSELGLPTSYPTPTKPTSSFTVGFMNIFAAVPALKSSQDAAQAEVEKLGGKFLSKDDQLDVVPDPLLELELLQAAMTKLTTTVVAVTVAARAVRPMKASIVILQIILLEGRICTELAPLSISTTAARRTVTTSRHVTVDRTNICNPDFGDRTHTHAEEQVETYE